MNREIKFRVRIFSPKDNYHIFEYHTLEQIINGSIKDVKNAGGIIKEIDQSTGLKDKNGKEIYEGDILQMLGRIGSVYWDDTGLWSSKWNEKGFNHRLFAFTESQFEVIGNIYENSDLLK